jgi:ABC-type transporter Mla subunit MlaD
MQKRRLAWIALAGIAIVLVVTVLAVWAFSSGGEEPGTGTGETVTTQTP